MPDRRTDPDRASRHGISRSWLRESPRLPAPAERGGLSGSAGVARVGVCGSVAPATSAASAHEVCAQADTPSAPPGGLSPDGAGTTGGVEPGVARHQRGDRTPISLSSVSGHIGCSLEATHVDSLRLACTDAEPPDVEATAAPSRALGRDLRRVPTCGPRGPAPRSIGHGPGAVPCTRVLSFRSRPFVSAVPGLRERPRVRPWDAPCSPRLVHRFLDGDARDSLR